MALKGALGEEGATLFADWSAQAAKNDPAATAKAWASFKPARIGAGTIYHLAMEKGWRPDPDLLLDGSQKVSAGDEHPAAGLLARLAQPGAPAPVRAPAPSFTLTIPGGLVGDLARYMIDTARRPQPLLAVGASLCALGALMGRRYRTATDLRTNLYIVGIADSGSGKNHAREVVNELFFAAGLAHHLGGNKIASGAGLLTALHRQPAILFQIDEFGMFLSAAADRKRSPRHVTEILDNMTELYTAASGVFLGAEYANRDGSNERRDIVQPCLCVYGTTTPLHFWGALQGANVVDGSLARLIILPSEEDYPDENRRAGLRRSPRPLIEGLQRLAEGGGRASGNLAGRTSGPETAVDPMTVPMDDDAQARFDAQRRARDPRRRRARPHGRVWPDPARRATRDRATLPAGLTPSQALPPPFPIFRKRRLSPTFSPVACTATAPLSQGNLQGDCERPSPKPDRRSAPLELQAVKLNSRGPQAPLTIFPT